MKKRGVGLGVTLVIVALLALAAFSLAALSVSRVHLLASLEARRKAAGLARSAIGAAFVRLRAQPTYGASGGDAPIVVASDAPGSTGQLVFDAPTAQSLGIVPSTNNLQGVQPVISAGSAPTAVAAGCARLVGVGTYAGCRVSIESLATMPVFPFALASTGALRSTQGLIVASVPDNSPTTLANLLADPVHYGKPANLVSNASGSGSVSILGPSTICGDLQSSGSVDFTGNPITVLGELRENAQATAVPNIPLAALNPLSLGLNPTLLTGAPSSNPTITGPVLCNGPFAVPGNLTLQNAVLYVKGDLTVDGSLLGNGELVVEGHAHLHGAADLTGVGPLSVVVGGDLSLDGSGSASSSFQGIVYTQGKLTAHGLKIFGSLIGGAPGPASGPQIDLQDCVVVQTNIPPPVSQVQVTCTLLNSNLYPQDTAFATGTATVTIAPSGLMTFAIDMGALGSVTVQASPSQPTPPAFASSILGVFPTATEVRFKDIATSPLAPPTDQERFCSDLTQSLNLGNFGLDLNKFINSSDSLHILTSRSLP